MNVRSQAALSRLPRYTFDPNYATRRTSRLRTKLQCISSPRPLLRYLRRHKFLDEYAETAPGPLQSCCQSCRRSHKSGLGIAQYLVGYFHFFQPVALIDYAVADP